MKWWFGSDEEDNMPLPKPNGEHGMIWDAINFLWRGQRVINKRLVRIEALLALGVIVGIAVLTMQIT